MQTLVATTGLIALMFVAVALRLVPWDTAFGVALSLVVITRSGG
jgi:hypothetical protein